MADSNAKHLSGLESITLQIFPGLTIAQIASKIDSGEAALGPYDFVIIHVGTNYTGNKTPI